MSYIKFDKEQLVNLRFALKREFIRSNRAGAFATSTIIGCNTRKYHGLFIVPQPDIDGGNHVLLSTVDETIIQQNEEFHMGMHCYPDGVLNPKGHKYISSLEMEPMPKFTYRVGGVIFTKEIMFCIESDRLMIKYTLEDAHSPTIIRLQPFLAFRNVHALTKANPNADTHAEPVENGIKIRMYPGYSTLFLQCSKKTTYTHGPHWKYNIEYVEEKERGYDFLEDIFVPGYFELPLRKGESVIFTAGLNETDTSKLKQIYSSETKKRIPRNNYKNCLINSGLQFFVTRNNKVDIIAGYPWFGRWGRDTFIALPGLTLAINEPEKCKAIMDHMIADLKGGLLPNVGCGADSSYNSVDAPLWFFWTLQQYAIYTGTQATIWQEYGDKMKLILNAYKNGCEYNIKMQDNGLIFAGEEGKALTWMDAIVDGKPVTPRIGLAVEINALWYNAVKFALEVAKLAGDQDFTKEWEETACKIPAAFKGTFWNKDRGYLCDYVNGEYKDWSVRPNQLLAASLPYSPVSEQIRELILEITERELLTRRGIRTLTPKSPDYKGIYKGGINERDAAYHQGVAWPWLLGHYAEAYLKIHPTYGLQHIKQLYESFEPVMMEHGIGTISELYDGDPPYLPGGAPSQAWSVAELLRIDYLIEKYSGGK